MNKSAKQFDGESSAVIRSFRGEITNAPIHPKERTLLIILGFHLSSLPWLLGTTPIWAQIFSFFLSIIEILTATRSRTYTNQLTKNSEFSIRPIRKLKSTPGAYMAGLFLVYIIIQALNPSLKYHVNEHFWWLQKIQSIHSLPSSVSSPFKIMNPWRMIIIYLSCYLTALSIWIGLVRRKSLLMLLTTLSINAFLFAVVALIQRLLLAQKILWLISAPAPYFVGTFIYKNHAGAYLNLMLTITAALSYIHYSKALRSHQKSSPAPLFVFIASAIVVAVIFSYSRAATILTIAFLIVALCIFLFREFVFGDRIRQQTFSIISVSFVLLAFVGLSLYTLVNADVYSHLERLLSGSLDPSVSGREAASNATILAIRDHLFFGTGVGSFQFIFPRYQAMFPSIHFSSGHLLYWEHAHNDFLEFTAEVGLVGVVPLLVLICRYFFSALRLVLGTESPYVFLILGLVMCLFHSWVDFGLYNPAILITFITLFPVSLRLLQHEDGSLR